MFNAKMFETYYIYGSINRFYKSRKGTGTRGESQIRGFQILGLWQIVTGYSDTSGIVPDPILGVDLKLWIFPIFGICRLEYQEENDCKGRIFCKISTEQREIFQKHQRRLSNSSWSWNKKQMKSHPKLRNLIRNFALPTPWKKVRMGILILTIDISS